MYQKLASLLLNIMKVCVVVPIVVLQTCGLVALVTLSAMANHLPDSWNRTFTKEEIDGLLKSDLRRFELGVHKMLPNVPLRQHEFDAIISFCFNLGLGCFQRSTIRQALLRGDKTQAMESLVKYCRAGGKILRGLQIRRLDERALFEGK
jgi:GH24 family phage-related lysozyme (muramidase)